MVYRRFEGAVVDTFFPLTPVNTGAQIKERHRQKVGSL